MLHTELSLGEYFSQVAARQPDAEIVVYPDRNLRWTYGYFNERVDRLAKGLLAIGVRKGDTVGVWARNVPDWLTFLFASAKLGAVLVTINTAYKSHELAHIVGQSDMKVLAFVDGYRDVDYVAAVRELIPESFTCERGQLKSSAFPHLRQLIYIGPEKYRGMYSVPELLLLGEHQPDADYLAAQRLVSGSDVVNIQYTSGTTGFPKGVMLTSRNIVNNGWFIGERQNLTVTDKVCLPVPLFHCFGLVLGIMAILTHGSTAVMLELFDPLLALAAIQKERCTALYGVPTMFIAELNHPMFSLFDMSSLRTGIMAGSPCPEETMRQVMTAMHCQEITIAYGLTESSPVITQTCTGDSIEQRTATVGKAMEEIEVRIVDPDTHCECAIGQIGEICCRGYVLMKGYYNLPEATAQVIDDEGWLHSGDLGTVDEQGYFRVTGRLKDMIIRGGENIYPREIEEFYYAMPGVEDVQVVGVPDEKYGEAVGAFIRRKAGYELTASDVREYAHTRIARYKCPKHVFFVESYPVTASGKIQKYKLRELATALLAT